MATLRDIKRRIGSVGNTMQITNAMKMVSTAKLMRAQMAVRTAQPYAEELRRMVTSIARGLTAEDHPLFRESEGGKSVAIVYTSDRGLCGVFNGNLNKAVFHFLSTTEGLPEQELITIGRVGNDFFRKRGFDISRSLVYLREVERTQTLLEIVGGLVERFVSGEVGRVFLAYNHFVNPINQQPRIVQLLPVRPPESAEPAGNGPVEEREMLFEPSRRQVLDALLPRYVRNQCYVAHLNTEAGEHGARMVAMEGATKNASDMIKRLTLQFNRARQAAITKELIEIVNGAQAL